MLHIRAFVSERLSAAALDIFGEVEKTLSLYQVEVSTSREEICLLRQELDLLRDSLQATSTMLDHTYLPDLQENGQGPPGVPAPIEKEEESVDHIVGREFLPGLSENSENYAWNSGMTQPNPEIPQMKEELDEFSIVVGVGPSPDVLKSEPHDRDGVEMEFTYQTLSPDDDAADEERAMGDERHRSCAEKSNVAKGLSDGNEQMGVTTTTTSPCEDDSTSRSSCHLCGKSYQYRASLMKHMKTHNSNCGVCGKTCASTETLLRHLSAAHGKSHFCDVCGRTFSQRSFLLKHARTHAGEREYLCNICGKAFFRKEHLVVHVRTHSGEKPYACDICGKAFSQSQNLTIHRRTHTGEKPYRCFACGKLFITSSQLKIHMRYHSDEKPYACDICGKQFRQSGQMTRHKRRTHAGEWHYGCTVCGKRYKFESSLKSHLRTHEKQTRAIKT